VKLAYVLGQACQQQLCLFLHHHHHYCKYGGLRADCHVQDAHVKRACSTCGPASHKLQSTDRCKFMRDRLTCLLGLAYNLCKPVLAREREPQRILRCCKVSIDRVQHMKLCRMQISHPSFCAYPKDLLPLPDGFSLCAGLLATRGYKQF